MENQTIGAIFDPEANKRRDLEKAKREADLRATARAKYGEDIAEGYLGYAEGIGLTHASKPVEVASKSFAEVIVRVLNHGTEEEQVQALTAVLDAINVVAWRKVERSRIRDSHWGI